MASLRVSRCPASRDHRPTATPTVFADLRTNVFNGYDRGLLGLALAPNFPADPRVYVLYSYDAEIGGTAPTAPPGNSRRD
jgi:hypothetical protein